MPPKRPPTLRLPDEAEAAMSLVGTILLVGRQADCARFKQEAWPSSSWPWIRIVTGPISARGHRRCHVMRVGPQDDVHDFAMRVLLEQQECIEVATLEQVQRMYLELA